MIFVFLLFLKEYLNSIDDIIIQNNIEELKNISIFEIPQEYNFSKLILMSDFHLGRKFYPNKSIPLLFKQIYKINALEVASMILILGDSVDSSYSNQFETHYYLAKNIEKINTTIFIIGGNHDREVIQKICKNSSYRSQFQHLKYINNPIISLKTSIKNYFFAHDLMYNFKIRGNLVPSFIHHLKTKSLFSHLFSMNDSLIIGHTHEQYANEENGEFCIGQFSIDSLKFDYATIETNSSNSFVQLKRWKYTI